MPVPLFLPTPRQWRILHVLNAKPSHLHHPLHVLKATGFADLSDITALVDAGCVEWLDHGSSGFVRITQAGCRWIEGSIYSQILQCIGNASVGRQGMPLLMILQSVGFPAADVRDAVERLGRAGLLDIREPDAEPHEAHLRVKMTKPGRSCLK